MVSILQIDGYECVIVLKWTVKTIQTFEDRHNRENVSHTHQAFNGLSKLETEKSTGKQDEVGGFTNI